MVVFAPTGLAGIPSPSTGSSRSDGDAAALRTAPAAARFQPYEAVETTRRRGRALARNPVRHQGLPRTARSGRRLPDGPRRRDPRHRRTQRLRQDHPVQRDQRLLPGRPRDRCGSPADDTTTGPSVHALPARHGPHLPEPAAVRPADRPGEHPRRARPDPGPAPSGSTRCGRSASCAASGSCAAQAEETPGPVRAHRLRRGRPGSLPYGIQRRIEIARAMACRPRLLLLDEPAAGLNGEEVRQLARHRPLHPRQRHHRRPHRAQHGPGDVAVRAGHRARQRRGHRGGHARRGGRRTPR